MTRPTLVLLDGSSLLYRAFYALPPLTTAAGTPTHAVFGLASMLLKVLEEEKPARIVLAFEGGKTFRHREFDAYKAQRPPTPGDLASQFALARTLAAAFGVPVVEHAGFEADDVLGTLARLGANPGNAVLIVTGDLDALQLVDEHVRVLVNRKGVSDTQCYDAAAVEARFGLPPALLPDFKALKGDPSDNIPGIPGVGDKTAATLLRQFGSLETLLERVEELKPSQVRANLLSGRDHARLYKRLATIVTDLPLQEALPGAEWPGPNPAQVQELFGELEFRSLVTRARALCPSGAGTPSPAPPCVAPAAVDWHTVQTGPDLADCLEALGRDERLGLRTAIPGGRDRNAAPAAIALAAAAGVLVVLPAEESGTPEMGSTDAPERDVEERGYLPVLSRLQRAAVVGHDLKQDLHVLARSGGVPRGLTPAGDTLLAAYVLNPGRATYSLDTLAQEHLGRTFPGEPGSPERVAHEAAALVPVEAQLRRRLEADRLLRVYEDIELPLIPLLREMEAAGVGVSPDGLRALSERLAARLRTLEGEAHTAAGGPFNLGSPKQLQEILFERLRLPRGRKTRTGYSTDSDVLQELADTHDQALPGLILRWRELARLKSTYADALPALLDPHDGRIHTRLNQAVAATGRLSSSEPNLQNIPIRTEEGREIRAAFVPAPGQILVSADYSQIELRIMAHLCRDAALLRAFHEDTDVHAATASEIFGVPVAEVTGDQRRRAKTVNFAVLYGQREYGLSRQLRIPMSEAKSLIASYFRRFPGVLHYVDATLAQARSLGYVTTLAPYCRRRYIPGIHADNRNERLAGEREAVNAPVQGTAADIMKVGMLRVADALRRSGLQSRMILQVHDELLFEALPAEAPALAALAAGEMEGAAVLEVPLRVEVRAGPNWRDLQVCP